MRHKRKGELMDKETESALLETPTYVKLKNELDLLRLKRMILEETLNIRRLEQKKKDLDSNTP